MPSAATFVASIAHAGTPHAPHASHAGAGSTGERPSRGGRSFCDGCVALQRLIVCSGAPALLQLPADLVAGLLQLLHTCTLHALRWSLPTAPPPEAEEVEEEEASALCESYDVLLEAWVSLLLGVSASGGRGRPAALDDAAFAGQSVDKSVASQWQVSDRSVSGQ